MSSHSVCLVVSFSVYHIDILGCIFDNNKMYIEPGIFNLHNFEQVHLGGNYEIKLIDNERKNEKNFNILGQIPYNNGNVLIRTDTANVEELVKLFIRYTYDKCEDLASEFDFSIKSVKRMRWGTICPTKEVLFIYKSKVFVAYGRYIYGYDSPCVVFQRGTEKIDLEPEDEDDVEPSNNLIKNEDAIEGDKVTLSIPTRDYYSDEYIYSFMIFDKNDETVEAFGLYR